MPWIPKVYKVTIVLLLWIVEVQGNWFLAQSDHLTLENAIGIGLENNLNLKISTVREQIASNNNTLGNAGFLPDVTTTGNLQYATSNSRQEFFNGDSRSAADAGSRSAGASIGLNWTIFEGFGRLAARERLALLVDRSKESTRAEVLELSSSIEASYYDLVRQEQEIRLTRQSIVLNLALRQLAEQKLSIGVGTELDVLQASNQVNADSSFLLAQLGVFERGKVTFNRLLARETDVAFQVDTLIRLTTLPTQEELIEQTVQAHPDLRLLQMDEQITELQIKEAKSALYPSLDFNANYNYSWSRSDVGFLLSNRSYGPVVGLRATYDIFPGRNLRKDIDNVELLQRTFQLSQEDLQEELAARIAAIYAEYYALVDLEQLELRNIVMAERNTYLAQELYRLGQTTNFEVREAILQEVEARDRLIDTQYQMKQAEVELRRLSGRTF